jgi:amino acid transporter
MSTLARGSVGPARLFVINVSASSPAVVIGGGIITTFAGTNVLGVPLSFVLIAVTLGLLLHSFATASQYIKHPAAGYALIAQGLNRVLGLAGGAVALVSYNSIQISLYGLIGVVGPTLPLGGPWWLWALGAWLIVAFLGPLRPSVHTAVIAILLLCQFLVVAAIIYSGLTNAFDGIKWQSFAPSALVQKDSGGVFALGVAAFFGVESAVFFSEEAQSKAVRRAVMSALVFTGLLYAVAAWSMVVATGPTGVFEAARSQFLPFGLLGDYALVGVVVLCLAIVAAAIAFHNNVARYLFALGREGVLPRRLARTRGDHIPVTGSFAQSGIALTVILIFTIFDVAPLDLFTWASTLAALGILSLLVTWAIAAISFFMRGHGRNEKTLTTLYAPVVGVMLGATMVVAMMFNIEVLLNTSSDAPATYILPGILIAFALIGIIWGVILRVSDPARFRSIGRGAPQAQEDPQRRLKSVRV